MSLSNQKSLIKPTLINLYPNEYSQEFHCYPFGVKLDRYVGSCNTLNDLSSKVCVPTAGINKYKCRYKCKYKCKFDRTKCDSNQRWNNDKCQCKFKKHNIC